MTYIKQTWATGDVITAEKLNHMEDGIAGGTLVIGGFSFDGDNVTGTADKTWQEIDDAMEAGVRCIIVYDYMSGHKQLDVEETVFYNEKYGFTAGTVTATADSADGYPVAGGLS